MFKPILPVINSREDLEDELFGLGQGRSYSITQAISKYIKKNFSIGEYERDINMQMSPSSGIFRKKYSVKGINPRLSMIDRD